MYTVKLAQDYINENKHKINPQFRFKYHAMAPYGWINDPNGLCYFNGNYHVFYQYNPYNSLPGPMHWGQLISTDLIKFEDLGVALAPDTDDETGCFSGGATVDVKNNELLLFYTKHYEKNSIKKETQYLVRSKDGINFVKGEKPIINIDALPHNADKQDFRDPNPYYHNGYYYIFIGSKSLDGIGQFLVYRSSDLKTFEYDFTIGPHPLFGTMGECPDFFHLDGYDILLFSATHLTKQANRFKNSNSSLYIIGKMDFEKKKYEIYKMEEIDGGCDFYAPQTLLTPDNERVMIGWMNMWDKEYYTHKHNHHWSGGLTIPRILQIKNNVFYQYPFKTINKYRQNQRTYQPKMHIGKTSDLELTFNKGDWEIIFANPNNKSDAFTIGLINGNLFVDITSSLLYPQERRYSLYQYHQGVTLRILLDNSSCELFINDGIDAITSLVYFDTKAYEVSISPLSTLVKAEIYDIVI